MDGFTLVSNWNNRGKDGQAVEYFNVLYKHGKVTSGQIYVTSASQIEKLEPFPS